MSFLENIVEITGNQYAAQGKTSNDNRTTIDTGSYVLNALLSGSIYGGASSNAVTAYAGETGTGKTFLALSIIRSFLESNERGSVIFFESEGAIDRSMFVERNIDVDRVFIVPVTTVQEFRTQALKILSKYEEEKEKEPVLFVLDSLGMLSTNKEMTDAEAGDDKRDMTRAQLIRGTFRILSLKLSMLGIPMYITNHTYQTMGMFATQELGGGSGLKYAASTIIMLSKKKVQDQGSVVGNIIHCKTYKSRLSKENQIVDIRLFYDRGLDKYYGLLDLAEKYDIIKKVGTRYEMPDGRKEFGKTIYDSPEKYFTDEIMKKIDEVAKEEFSYGFRGEEDG